MSGGMDGAILVNGNRKNQKQLQTGGVVSVLFFPNTGIKKERMALAWCTIAEHLLCSCNQCTEIKRYRQLRKIESSNFTAAAKQH